MNQNYAYFCQIGKKLVDMCYEMKKVENCYSRPCQSFISQCEQIMRIFPKAIKDRRSREPVGHRRENIKNGNNENKGKNENDKGRLPLVHCLQASVCSNVCLCVKNRK